MPLYTKTALKKIKKDELVQMFLDQQAQINDIKMELNDFVSVFDGNVSMKKMTEDNKKLKKENEKLKGDIVYLKHQKSVQREKLKEFMDEINKLKEKHEQSEEVLQELGYTYQEGMGYVHKDD